MATRMCRTPQHGEFFEPHNDPRNRGKFYFSTPQTRPQNRIYLIPIPGTAIVIIYTGVYVEQYGISQAFYESGLTLKLNPLTNSMFKLRLNACFYLGW
jgi:hypothetical protein